MDNLCFWMFLKLQVLSWKCPFILFGIVMKQKLVLIIVLRPLVIEYSRALFSCLWLTHLHQHHTKITIIIITSPKLSSSSLLHRQNCHHHHHCIAKIVIIIIIASPKLFAPRSPFTPPLSSMSAHSGKGGRGRRSQTILDDNQSQTSWNNLKKTQTISNNLKQSETILIDNQSQRI